MLASPAIPSLTGFRWIAAALILLAHTMPLFTAPGLSSYASASLGRLGMTLFFVLSGFVIHYNYGDRVARLRVPALRSFGVARLARLYPLYLGMLMFDLAVRATHPSFDLQTLTAALPYYLTLSQSWFPIWVGDQHLCTVYFGLAWSISAEA